MKRTVYVVSFHPVKDRASVGGFDWFPTLKEAEVCFDKYVAKAPTEHVYSLVPYEVEPNLSNDQITEQIDADLVMVERTMRALRKSFPSRSP